MRLIALIQLYVHASSTGIEGHMEIFEKSMPAQERRNRKFIAKSSEDSNRITGNFHLHFVKVG